MRDGSSRARRVPFGADATDPVIRINDRLSVRSLLGSAPAGADAGDVVDGLTAPQKHVPTRYCYDDRGSELFERRCEQPEYYLMRAEIEILRKHATEIAAATGCCELVELGCGNAHKVPLIFGGYRSIGCDVTYHPVDINCNSLIKGSRHLLGLFPELSIDALHGTYEQGLEAVPDRGRPRTLLFLGSSIGNLDDDQLDDLFAMGARTFRPGDYFLIGADMEKDPAVSTAAYNDANGIGAEMEINVLTHLNRLFDGDFDPAKFRHEAIYNAPMKRVEAHLFALVEQVCSLSKLGLTISLEHGESIRTDIMRKFSLTQLATAANARGFGLSATWADVRNWYAVLLFRLEGSGAHGVEVV